ncbi:MAG: hypothetical protein JW726_02140 [Anaerolineales bacterium]|nr:hypothetical protein [Anaerolineales bacterium]
MDIDSFRALFNPLGQQALLEAAALTPREVDFLAHFQTLSRRFPPELARTALEIAILRAEAARKFPFAEKLYFTRPALEQASSYEVATYRAQRYSHFEALADLGCSVGCDSFALAPLAPTLAVDLDSLRMQMAQANLGALGLEKRVQLISADLTSDLPIQPPHTPSAIGLFFDPARRVRYKRVMSVRQYLPPLDTIQGWLPSFPALGVKLSPGVNLDELAPYPAEVEFISLRGELKEAVLWFGPLRSASRRATLLPGLHTLTASGTNPPSAPIRAPQAFLYEPDPAILRAGLVTTLAEQLGAAQLDPDIAYLTSQQFTATPFARAWAIEDWLPFHLKRLRAYLRQRDVGRVTVKKRGSPLEPRTLIHNLRLSGAAERILVLTHWNGAPIVLVCLPPVT